MLRHRVARPGTGRPHPRHAVCAALLTALAATPLPTSHAQDVSWTAFAQLTAEHGEEHDSVRFGADLVRFALRVQQSPWTAFMMVDVNNGDLSARAPGALANVVTDLWVEHAWSERFSARVGQFRAPLGMDYLLPGAGLDIAKRGMEKGLVLERTIGAMLRANGLSGGLGFEAGVFNPAGRSSATAHVGSGPLDQVGDDLAYAARVTFDPNAQFHGELAYGASQDAGGPGTADYKVFDLGASWLSGPWTLRAELIAGQNVRGTSGRDERVWYAHAGYAFTPRVSGVLRHYDGESELPMGDTSLTNTFVGVTWFFDAAQRRNHRLMLNYVLAGGDTTAYTGVRGYRDDTVLAQFQFFISR